MMESRLLGAATARKLQTNNWKRLCITNGCLIIIGKSGSMGNLSTESPTISPSVYNRPKQM